jgi:ribosomal peptide maturation radical SAM protein 1
MGPQLIRSFPFIDYAFAGDGDVSFPLFLKTVEEGRPVDIPGVFAQPNGTGGQPTTVQPLLRWDMDALPYPDFTDWFAAYARAPGNDGYKMSIPVEGSRGCWWGEKHHCTFCGLNGTTMAYRAKSPERFCEEVDALVKRYGVKSVMATDNILDSRWPKKLLPLLKEKRSYDVLFFEIKANLSKEDIQQLAECGITHMNPGIESFSTHVLQVMDKGANALQNVQILKWAEELGVTLQYCFISGFPGETAKDYDEIAALIPKIVHLKPGKTFTRISIDRFSPYFTRPEQYGMSLGPCPAYRYVYDLPAEEIANIAYWYYSESETGSSRVSLEPPEYAGRVAQLYRIWLSLYGKVSFSYTVDEAGLVELADTRPIAAEARGRLDPLESALFLLADRVTSPQGLERSLRSQPAWASVREGEIDAALDRLEQRSALHRDGHRCLALANRNTGTPKGPVMSEVRLSPRTD